MKHAQPQLDHLVIAAATLEQGVQWCQGVLGVAPDAGGAHPLMGTHNRLARLSSTAFPNSYLEIIAIDPEAAPEKPPEQARWFGLDQPALQTRLRTQGPQLVHWVARVPDLAQALEICAQHGIAPGLAHGASRTTPSGVLQWDISIPPDGQAAAQGMWPTLISWGQTHPTDRMAPSGLVLQKLRIQHPQATALNGLWQALGASDVPFAIGPSRLEAALHSPRGYLKLHTTLDNP